MFVSLAMAEEQVLNSEIVTDRLKLCFCVLQFFQGQSLSVRSVRSFRVDFKQSIEDRRGRHQVLKKRGGGCTEGRGTEIPRIMFCT